MAKRIISAVVGIPLMIFLIYKGKTLFLAAVMLLALLAAIELGRLMKRMGIRDMVTFLYAGALLFPLLLYFEASWLPHFLALFVFSGVLISISHYPESKLGDLGVNFFSILYIAFGFSHFVLLRQMTQGLLLVTYAFVIIWLTDIGSFFAGTYLGKRPFFTNISPNKTLEGAIGGLAAGVIGAIVFCVLVNQRLELEHMRFLLVLSPFLSAAGQCGDFFASTLKRQAGVKDSSRLIPGHGGILDRFDSALWVIPLLYHFLRLRIDIFM
jgi:phosphatidate cytidylyltransferase